MLQLTKYVNNNRKYTFLEIFIKILFKLDGYLFVVILVLIVLACVDISYTFVCIYLKKIDFVMNLMTKFTNENVKPVVETVLIAKCNWKH